MRWSQPLFPDETPAQTRLRRAAALLSDIGWNEHPDYRAEQVFMRCLRMPVPGVDHAGRAFLAAALHARYGGDPQGPPLPGLGALIDQTAMERARAIGQVFRLAYTLTGGAVGLIGSATLAVRDGDLILNVPSRTAIYSGEAVQRRLDALGRTLNHRGVVKVTT